MKHTLFILALITASIQTFAQSPRIKLNQITKDSLTGSVLISSPTDSGMVYSRDLFISYGADTFLILGGDTLAATSETISSVLSDGVTITGDGTTGSELTVDTATVIATKGDLNNIDLASQVTGTLPIANGGTGSATQNFVDLSTTQTVGGAKTFTSALTQSGGDVNFDANTLFVDAANNRVGIGTPSPNAKMQVNFSSYETALQFNNVNTQYALIVLQALGVTKALIGYNSNNSQFGGESGTGTLIQADGQYGLYMDTNLNIYLGSSVIAPTEKLDVNGNARFRSIGSGASAGALHYTSTGVLTTNTSDVRLKTNLQPLENTLQKLLDINTYTFNWINEADRVDLGMVAQEVEEIFPHLVFSNPVDGYKGIHYDKFSSILTKAIQEQQAIIDQQKNEIEQLKSQIQLILSEIEQIKNN